MDGDASKVFVDADGSVTGVPGRAVVADNPFLLDASCSYQGPWNAHVCASEYVSLIVGSSGGTAAIKPLLLTRDDGVQQRLMGCCEDSEDAITSLFPEQNYSVSFNGGTPERTRFVLWRAKGTWVRLEVPMSSVGKVTRWGYPVPSVGGLTALANSNDSAYFFDGSTLHLKIVGTGSYEEIKVTR